MGSPFSQSPRFDDAHLTEKKIDKRRWQSRRDEHQRQENLLSRKNILPSTGGGLPVPSLLVFSPSAPCAKKLFSQKSKVPPPVKQKASHRSPKPQKAKVAGNSVAAQVGTVSGQPQGAEKEARMPSAHPDHGAHQTPGNPLKSEAGRRPQGALSHSKHLVRNTAHR